MSSEMDSTDEKGTSILINHKVVKFKKWLLRRKLNHDVPYIDMKLF